MLPNLPTLVAKCPYVSHSSVLHFSPIFRILSPIHYSVLHLLINYETPLNTSITSLSLLSFISLSSMMFSITFATSPRCWFSPCYTLQSSNSCCPHYHSHCSTLPCAVGNTSGVPSVCFLGLSSAMNHTSQEQLNRWKTFINESYKLWNSSPRGSWQSADFQTFFLCTLTIITDHADDQKKLKQLFQELKIHYDHEIQGEHTLLLLSPDELLQMLYKLNTKKFEDAGGLLCLVFGPCSCTCALQFFCTYFAPLLHMSTVNLPLPCISNFLLLSSYLCHRNYLHCTQISLICCILLFPMNFSAPLLCSKFFCANSLVIPLSHWSHICLCCCTPPQKSPSDFCCILCTFHSTLHFCIHTLVIPVISVSSLHICMPQTFPLILTFALTPNPASSLSAPKGLSCKEGILLWAATPPPIVTHFSYLPHNICHTCDYLPYPPAPYEQVTSYFSYCFVSVQPLQSFQVILLYLHGQVLHCEISAIPPQTSAASEIIGIIPRA